MHSPLHPNSTANVFCFWDLENVSVPKNVDGIRASKCLRDIMEPMGIIREIRAYSHFNNVRKNLREQLRISGISLQDIQSRKGEAVDKAIIVDMMFIFSDYSHRVETGPLIFILISADNDYAYLLSRLRQRKVKIVLILTAAGGTDLLKAPAHEIYDWHDILNPEPEVEESDLLNYNQISSETFIDSITGNASQSLIQQHSSSKALLSSFSTNFSDLLASSSIMTTASESPQRISHLLEVMRNLADRGLASPSIEVVCKTFSARYPGLGRKGVIFNIIASAIVSGFLIKNGNNLSLQVSAEEDDDDDATQATQKVPSATTETSLLMESAAISKPKSKPVSDFLVHSTTNNPILCEFPESPRYSLQQTICKYCKTLNNILQESGREFVRLSQFGSHLKSNTKVVLPMKSLKFATFLKEKGILKLAKVESGGQDHYSIGLAKPLKEIYEDYSFSDPMTDRTSTSPLPSPSSSIPQYFRHPDIF